MKNTADALYTFDGHERDLKSSARRVVVGDKVNPKVSRVAGEYDRLLVVLASLEYYSSFWPVYQKNQ